MLRSEGSDGSVGSMTFTRAARLRLAQLPAEPISGAFARALKDLNRPGHENPVVGLTSEDYLRFLDRQRAEIEETLATTSDFEQLQFRRQQLRAVEESVEDAREAVRAHARSLLARGEWVGVGRLGSQVEVVPKSAWYGTLDWVAGSLRSGGRFYNDLRVISADLNSEQRRVLDQFVTEVELAESGTRLEPEAPPRGRGRPSQKSEILVRFQKLLSSQTLKATLRATAQEIERSLKKDYGPSAPNLNTIERHISRPYREACSGEIPSPQK